MRPPTRSTRSVLAASTSESIYHHKHTILPPSYLFTSSVSAGSSIASQIKYWNEIPYKRHRMTDEELSLLEAMFEQNTHPSKEEKQALAEQLGMYV